MKKHMPSFVAGSLTMALIGSLGIGALAASGAMTITVDPINVQVNGQVFAPKDVNGQDVPVFSYNGTTYAPLRALAEAYGLEVGYDAGSNMATVTGDIAAPGDATTPAPDTTASVADYSDWTAEEEAAYQEFKGMWDIKYLDSGNFKGDILGNVIGGPWEAYELTYNGGLSASRLNDMINTARENGFARKLVDELTDTNATIELRFGGNGVYLNTITIDTVMQK